MIQQIAQLKNKRWHRILRQVIYWALPVAILYVVFRRVDIESLRQSFSQTNPWLVVMGLLLNPVVVTIGALRWFSLLTKYYQVRVPVRFALKHYWIGLALGVFAPGSIGWDVYRVVVSGRHFGQYSANVAIILVEKLMALFTCLSLALVLYPLLPIAHSSVIEGVLRVAVYLFIVFLIVAAAVVLTFRNRVLSGLVDKMEVRLGRAIERLTKRFVVGDTGADRRVSLRMLMEPLVTPERVLPVLFLSFSIQLVCAFRDLVYLRAMGYDLPYAANLFVTPVLFFIFLLPISFGSLGVREGAYILLYGLFGVPSEIALLLSFFNLTGILLDNLIGGGVMLLSNIRVQDSLKTTQEIDLIDSR
ncbi:MAG: flippase-like domain-containing protein [Anaerolineae bacterium]|nr:flippase-like domain-containing protein [Anaerolineae bacterium]